MGLDIGLEKAGFHTTFANEIDPRFCETIRLNRPSLPLAECSITDLTAADIRRFVDFDGDVDLMVGGPPCQSFSSGGKRAALSDPRGNLIYAYLRLISEVRPRYFILENVANLTTAAVRHRPISERPGKHWSLKTYDSSWKLGDGENAPLAEDELSGSAIRQLLNDVRSLKYFITFGVVDAADYGAPQHRLRFVMIGSRDFPPPEMPIPLFGLSARRPFRTVRDAIWDLRADPGEGSQYTHEVKRFFDLVPEGKNWRALPEQLKRAALGGAYESGGGKTGFFRRLAWDRPSPTITGRANRKGSALCHPFDTRPLSVNECAALQGFPEDWKFSGSMNVRYMQIGNAVPTALGTAIGKSIKRHRAAAAASPQDDMDLLLERAVHRLRQAASNKKKPLYERA